MKKTLLFPVLAFALMAMASCTSTTEDNTTVNTSDTMYTEPGMQTATPATDANGATPSDNTEGGISTGSSDASMDATGVGTGVGAGTSRGAASGSRSGTSANTSGRAGMAEPMDNANTSNPQSTYEQAKPGAPVDGRMPRGTSVEK